MFIFFSIPAFPGFPWIFQDPGGNNQKPGKMAARVLYLLAFLVPLVFGQTVRTVNGSLLFEVGGATLTMTSGLSCAAPPAPSTIVEVYQPQVSLVFPEAEAIITSISRVDPIVL